MAEDRLTADLAALSQGCGPREHGMAVAQADRFAGLSGAAEATRSGRYRAQ
jgi:hypothetical protein